MVEQHLGTRRERELVNVKRMIVLIAVVSLIAPMAFSQGAFAAFPYIGAYRDSSTVHHPLQFLGRVNFDGSTSVSSYSGPVTTTAGWGTTNPTRMVYQAPTWLETDGTIWSSPQVHKIGQAPPAWIREDQLGEHGSGSTDIDYVYYTFFWNSARTQVTFYYEPHFNDGTATSYLDTYSKVSGDTSTNFAAGWKDITVNSVNYRFKLLQIGAESASSTSGWKFKQYGMTYYCNDGSCTTVNLSSVIARSLVWDTTSTTYESWISYYGNEVRRVGEQNYVAQADYDLKSGSTLPPGEVVWYKSSTSVPAGTRLW